VRVIVLFRENGSDDIDEAEWLYAGTTNPAFRSLKDPAEDVYTLADGRPFDDALDDKG
jgi:hypothetical protein